MNISKKSPAELEHQVADYLLRDDHPGMMRAWYLSEIAQLLLATDPDGLMHNASFRDMNPNVQDDDIEVFVEKYPLHLSGQSNKPHAEREIYYQKTEAVERYEREFKDLIDSIDRTADTGMMSGYHSTPHIIEKDGQEYVVRDINPETSLHEVEKHIDAALKVRGIDHIEQVEAVSYVDGITVAPRMPGRYLKNLQATGDAKYVTEAQVRELYEAMKEVNSRGAGFDGIGNNFLYDARQGFNVVDLEPFLPRSTAATSLTRQIEYLVDDADLDLPYLYELQRITECVVDLIKQDLRSGENGEAIRMIRADLETKIAQAEAHLLKS